MEIKVEVLHVRRSGMSTQEPEVFFFGQALIILKESDGDRVLPMTSEDGQALAIQRAKFIAEGNVLPGRARPTMHDLFLNFIQEHQSIVEKIVVTSFRGEPFISSIHIKYPDGQIKEIDARPSDAIVLALLAKSDILVSEELLKKPEAPSDSAMEILKRRAEAALEQIPDNKPES